MTLTLTLTLTLTFHPHPHPHLTQAHYHMTNFREEYGDGKWDVSREEAAESVFCPVVPHLQDRLYYT